MKAKALIINKCDGQDLVIAPKRNYASRTKLTQKDLEALKLLAIDAVNANDYKSYRFFWKEVFRKCNLTNSNIKKVVIAIEEAESIDEIKSIAQEIAKAYYQQENKNKTEEKESTFRFQKAMNDKTGIGIAAFVKEALYCKYFTLYEKYNTRELDDMYNELITTKDTNLLEHLIDLSQQIDDEHSAKIQDYMLNFSNRIMADSLIRIYDERSPHLCWQNCGNARANKCDKIADGPKKIINQYSFITRGNQVIKNSKVVDFSVTGCKNYYYVPERSMPFVNRKKLMREIKIVYFDSENIEEANRVQATTFGNGTLRRRR